MSDFNLGPSEVVLAELGNVYERKGMTTGALGSLILTNENIIWVKNGLFGKQKPAGKFPLSDVKVYEGAAQVRVVTKSGVQVVVELYLKSGQRSFAISGFGDTEAKNFANALNHIVTGTDEDLYGSGESALKTGTILRGLMGADVEAKRAARQEKIAITCSSCGGSFEAAKGKTAKCPYCGSAINT